LQGQLDLEKGKAKEALDLYRKQVLTAFGERLIPLSQVCLNVVFWAD
jgi:hypothetical protein